MNIQHQIGIVSTINFVPYVESTQFQVMRKTLFEDAITASKCSPCNQIDVFDESIFIFDNFQQALNFLLHVFRAAVKLTEQSNFEISLRSSLCQGNYYLHQEQIYGDAVNLATSLSCTSRENELRVCGIDKQVINTFICNQDDVACYIRSEDDDCVSIGLLDKDSTQVNLDKKVFQIGHCLQSQQYETSRNRQITIGRQQESDIYIIGDPISRCHATITLNYENAFIEDHSSNGTYVYTDDREIFVGQDKIKLPEKGQISCGINRDANIKSSDIISFEFVEEETDKGLLKMAN